MTNSRLKYSAVVTKNADTVEQSTEQAWCFKLFSRLLLEQGCSLYCISVIKAISLICGDHNDDD